MKAAFFDIDGTLVKRSAAFYYVVKFALKKKAGVFYLAKALYYHILHRINLLDGRKALAYLVKPLKEEKHSHIKKIAEQYFKQNIKNNICQNLEKEIKQLKKKGYKIGLLTASPDFIAEVFKKYLGAKYVVATELVVRKGVYTGKVNRVAYGKGKFKMFKELMKKQGLQKKDCYFYSDSYTDVDVLNYVGNPVVVEPDAKLKKYALRKKWRIIRC